MLLAVHVADVGARGTRAEAKVFEDGIEVVPPTEGPRGDDRGAMDRIEDERESTVAALRDAREFHRQGGAIVVPRGDGCSS